MMAAAAPPRLWLLAAYKLAFGVALCAVAFELVELLDEDLAAVAYEWILRLHADPHNPLVVAIMGRAGQVDRASLEEYAVVSGFFGNVHLIEGIGLWLQKYWAEYVCLLSTALFLPLEVFEALEEPHVATVGMLAFNVAVVAYFAWRLGLAQWIRRAV